MRTFIFTSVSLVAPYRGCPSLEKHGCFLTRNSSIPIYGLCLVLQLCSLEEMELSCNTTYNQWADVALFLEESSHVVLILEICNWVEWSFKGQLTTYNGRTGFMLFTTENVILHYICNHRRCTKSVQSFCWQI